MKDLLTRMKKKVKYYVVWEGHKSGIYNSWEECKKQIKNSRLKVIPRAAHMSPVEEPELVNSAIQEFLLNLNYDQPV